MNTNRLRKTRVLGANLSIFKYVVPLLLIYIGVVNVGNATINPKFTLYVTPMFPGIILAMGEGPPFGYIDFDADLPFSGFSFADKRLSRITINLETQYYIRQRQLTSVLDEYILNARYFVRDTKAGAMYYTAGTKVVYDRIKNSFSVPLSGGIMFRRDLTNWLYLTFPSDASLYSDGIELQTTVKMRMVIRKIGLGLNFLFRGVVFSKYNFSRTAGDVFLGIGFGFER